LFPLLNLLVKATFRSHVKSHFQRFEAEMHVKQGGLNGAAVAGFVPVTSLSNLPMVNTLLKEREQVYTIVFV
jgi:hypothetical protein